MSKKDGDVKTIAEILVEERDALEAKLQIAVEALDFYVNKANWGKGLDVWGEVGEFYSQLIGTEHGYDRAKEALEKIGEW